MIRWLLPWEFSPAVALCCLAAAVLYGRGTRALRFRGTPTFTWQRVSFALGLALIYIPLQSRFDYLAQHMFWIHRIQHLLLHHVAPFLVDLAAPWTVMAVGLPARWRNVARALLFNIPLRRLYWAAQQPVVAAALFTGLICFWLWPAVHFDAMLDAREYDWMNWSMVLDGLLFWWLMLDPRSAREGARIGFGARIVVVLLAMQPQLLIGAYLSLHAGIVYEAYAVCGRLWPVNPITDQQIGGLITWIPACMMSVVATLVLWRRWMKNDHRERNPGVSIGVPQRVAVTASQLSAPVVHAK